MVFIILGPKKCIKKVRDTFPRTPEIFDKIQINKETETTIIFDCKYIKLKVYLLHI